ncbi:MAG TPA: hypothetical protein VN372_00270 [Methanospirillum sp.]|nr:hypothetical protein [Methanospirillum sp.]
MLTIFSIPKPFTGHTGIIQENAIRSWISCIPGVEVILLGDEEGTGDVAIRYGCRHIPFIELNESGTPILSYAFEKVQEIAIYDQICYVNGDIIFLSGVSRALASIKSPRFLMVGRRTNLDVSILINLQDPIERKTLANRVNDFGEQDKPWAIDFFIFPKGQVRNMPRFVVGRAGWDNWMIWYHTKSIRVPVIDATPVVVAVHQKHDYGHVRNGSGAQWEGPESEANRMIMGGWERRYYSILDSDYYIRPDGEIKWTRISSAFLKQKGKRMIIALIPDSLLQKIRMMNASGRGKR